MSKLTDRLKTWSARRSADRPPRPARFVSGFESLESRLMPAVTATFSAQAGLLTVLGDNQDNTITLSRNAAGTILVNGGAVSVVGGTPTVANTALITGFGQGGSDTLTLDEANGALPRANLFGGTGNDALTGGSGGDMLFGQAGNDTQQGRGGFDFLFGGGNNDTLTGGDDDDQVFGQSGNDRMIWNPGDDTDLNEGGAGTDTVRVNGGNGAETFTIAANGARVRFDRTDPAPFAIDIGTTENLVVSANGGDDSVSAGLGLAPLIRITMDGGAGNDTLLGSDGIDLQIGSGGNDFVDGNRGNDVAFLGAGDDVFRWDPGDGNDIVEGQAGTDALLFNGANANENVDVSANGARVRFFRDVASVTMDLDDVERIDFNARRGTDRVVVNDLSGTDLTALNIDLGASPGGATGDAQVDTIVVNGTDGDDTVAVLGSGASYVVAGLAASVTVVDSEATDQLTVNSLGGEDEVSAPGLPAATVKLTMDGGDDDDDLLGGDGNDVLRGGDGDDFVEGNRGDDVAFLGAGDDLFRWDPGDGSDVVEGQAGTDLLFFNGSGASENIDIAANGPRVRFFRDVASVTMDLDDVEQIAFNALGGADTIVVNDLSGTDLTEVNLDLFGPGGTGDGQVDRVIVSGTAADDDIVITGTGTSVAVNGAPAVVNIFGSEGANDRLTVNALGGEDFVDASGLAAGVIALAINGGAAADVLIGSPGNDLVNGGAGDDLALLGAGDDVFVWNPGDGSDTVEGQAGADALRFNGANVSENIDIAANGSRVRFFRDVATITMDLDDVERIDFNALGGADTIVVNDLSGTDVTEVNLALAAAGGVGDLQADNVIVNATNGDDVVLPTGDATGVAVLGLAARVNISGAEAANDRLTINALAGDDVVEASGLAAGAIRLTENGGNGADVLIGGAGDDVLSGGAGDDVLIGGPGLDSLDGGPGDNILIA
jgi:Ca2+-binding RTX toxin-like protein